MIMTDLIWEGKEIIKQAVLFYKGTGYLIELFLVMLVVLFFLSRKYSFERKIVMYSVLSMLVLCNPFVAVVLKRVALETVYWRTLWILLMGIVITSAAVAIISRIKNRGFKIFALLFFVVFVVKAGSPVFTEDNFQRTENCYKIPDIAVKTADIILADAKGTAKIIAPEEISTWIREYSSDIIVPYGRGYIYGYEGWIAESEYLRSIWANEILDLNKINEVVRVWGYDYLIINKERAEVDSVVSFGYDLLDASTDYYIYKCIREEE